MHRSIDPINHVQVSIYGENGVTWDIVTDKGIIWPKLHIPKNRALWKIVSFITRIE